MLAYLLTWNPQKWPWEDMEEDIDELLKKGSVTRNSSSFAAE
jgi:hypothetical protein